MEKMDQMFRTSVMHLVAMKTWIVGISFLQ